MRSRSLEEVRRELEDGRQGVTDQATTNEEADNNNNMLRLSMLKICAISVGPLALPTLQCYQTKRWKIA